MTSCDPQSCCKAVRSAILATAWLFILPVWQMNGRRQWQCVVSLCPSLSMFLLMIQWSVAVINRMPPRWVQFHCCSAFWRDIHIHAHSQLLCIEVQPISTEWLWSLLTQVAVHCGRTGRLLPRKKCLRWPPKQTIGQVRLSCVRRQAVPEPRCCRNELLKLHGQPIAFSF